MFVYKIYIVLLYCIILELSSCLLAVWGYTFFVTWSRWVVPGVVVDLEGNNLSSKYACSCLRDGWNNVRYSAMSNLTVQFYAGLSFPRKFKQSRPKIWCNESRIIRYEVQPKVRHIIYEIITAELKISVGAVRKHLHKKTKERFWTNTKKRFWLSVMRMEADHHCPFARSSGSITWHQIIVILSWIGRDVAIVFLFNRGIMDLPSKWLHVIKQIGS